MVSYEEYLQHPGGDTLTLEEALEIYTDIIEGLKKCDLDDDLQEVVDEFVQNACAYAIVRTKWEFYSMQQRIEKDESRTANHNIFITSVNMIARIMQNSGLDITWRDKLGDSRKKIGDFACFVNYMVGVKNR